MRLYEIDAQGESRIVQWTPEWVGEVCRTTVARYRRTGFVRPWTGYLAETAHAVVGTCAFKAPPHAGEVEIVYFTFPDYEGEGFATEMARQLVAIARQAEPAIVVTARTLPEENPSTSVLRKLGFIQRGPVVDEEEGELMEWMLPSAAGGNGTDAA